MENPSFEDVFPIQDGDFPASYVCLPEGKSAVLLEGMSCWKLGSMDLFHPCISRLVSQTSCFLGESVTQTYNKDRESITKSAGNPSTLW